MKLSTKSFAILAVIIASYIGCAKDASTKPIVLEESTIHHLWYKISSSDPLALPTYTTYAKGDYLDLRNDTVAYVFAQGAPKPMDTLSYVQTSDTVQFNYYDASKKLIRLDFNSIQALNDSLLVFKRFSYYYNPHWGTNPIIDTLKR